MVADTPALMRTLNTTNAAVNHEITFALDARANSVLVDRRPEAEISVLPGSRYSVTAAGHLGDEVSSPEALVMFKDHLSGELKVFAVGEGDGLRHVAPWDQLLAVVVDLDSAEPRTGTVRLQPRPH